MFHLVVKYDPFVAHPERLPRSTIAGQSPTPPEEKAEPRRVGRSARADLDASRPPGLGLVLMVVNRLAGLVLPATTKYLMDDVIGQGHWDLLPTLALAAGAATLVDAVTSFANSQILGVAAQRAITDMRKDVEAHVMRLPIRYFDSTQDRRPDLAHHDRRRRHPEPRRHRPGAADRLDPHRGRSRSASCST